MAHGRKENNKEAAVPKLKEAHPGAEEAGGQEEEDTRQLWVAGVIFL
jgi:hypothetical protein